eukprot:TRINITY_DN4591_c0_g1_i2.p1 TRINITY_DN4591_c0_g1~~TRINITY_DN4591_c0_g1_i2.p1  ORF type:complete len:386 (+),score=44.31 TRINITY_DN4591_c0_g1_i2:82-1158(+)
MEAGCHADTSGLLGNAPLRRHAVAACAANVVISIGSTLLYLLELYHLPGSPLFANQLNAAFQVVICGALLCFIRFFGSPAQPLYIAPCRWAELALLFAMQNTLEIASIDGLGHDNGALAPILFQAVIPMTLCASSVLLGRKYLPMHWLAAGVVLAGIAVAYTPNCATASLAHRWPWAVLLVVSRVPQSLANVRLEGLMAQCTLKGSVEPVLQAGFFTSLLALAFNVPLGLLLCLGSGLPLDALRADYHLGLESLQGLGGHAAAWPAAAAFALPGTLFTLSEFHVLQQASASTYFLLVALELPLQAVAISMESIMGSLAGTFYPSLVWGLPLIVVGLSLWAYAEGTLCTEVRCALTDQR